MSILDWLLNPTGLTAHGFCLSWAPGLVALHAVSDAVTGIAYFSIPLVLFSFARKRKDLVDKGPIYLFVAFILACGATHFLAILTMWVPVYGIEGLVKALMAGLSVYTAVMLWPLLPRALALPSPSQLKNANDQLTITMADLEVRVSQRTQALEEANRDLDAAVRQSEKLIGELKRSEIIKDEFVSTVNHELRTPLTSIFASLRLLGVTTAGKLDKKSERLLEVAQISCSHLTALVNDILDIEKMAAGKMDYHMETLAAGPLIEGIIDRHAVIAEQYGVRFDVHLDVMDLAIQVDQNRFNQAVVNLLSNAAKYSTSGDQVEIVARREGNASIRLSVTDHGPGIPEAFRDRIFGRFAQADNSTTRAVGGNGLGLNITKTLIEAFGGVVSFDSVEGQGATFHIVLPVQDLATPILEPNSHG